LFHLSDAPAIYTLSLHDALPILAGGRFRLVAAARQSGGFGPSAVGRHLCRADAGSREGDPDPADRRRALLGLWPARGRAAGARTDRKSTRLNSSHVEISYAVFCL